MINHSMLTFAILMSVCISSRAADQPHVILFIADDVSFNDYHCYGNDQARTPNIDQLAKHGIQFHNAYLTASSCSPSRSSIVTGRYPHNNGKAAELHLPIASNLVWFPKLLREAGYYTALSGKNHMTRADPVSGEKVPQEAYEHIDGGKTKDNHGGHANWVSVLQNRPVDRPFFGWYAAYDAHRAWDADRQWHKDEYGPMHTPENVVVPPFLSDDPETRQDLASYHNEITRFDYFIGEVVEELISQKMFENTLIFVLADNGRPFPRAKTRLHDSGMKTALVAHWPEGISSSQNHCQSIVSVIDLAPTILEAAGIPVADTMQGVSLNPIFEDANQSVRQYAFSEHNWHDYEAHGRSVRYKNFLYLRNFRPQYPWQGPADAVRSPSFLQLLDLKKKESLSPAQQDVFLAPRAEEELYDLSKDRYQLNNLIDDKDHADKQKQLSRILKEWMKQTGDSIPAEISHDSFDRFTGKRIAQKNSEYRRMTPGEDRQSWTINAPGPR